MEIWRNKAPSLGKTTTQVKGPQIHTLHLYGVTGSGTSSQKGHQVMVEIRAKMTLEVTSLLICTASELTLGKTRQIHFDYPCVQGT